MLLVYALPIIEPPFISTPNSDFPNVLFTVTLYAIVAVGLNIVTGYAGLLDLGYVGFYATGAYIVGLFTAYHFAWPFLLVLPLAMGVTLLTGILLGAPTLRVRGDYLAIVTMGFGELIRITIRNTDWLGGPGGIKAIPSPDGLGEPDGLFQIPHLHWEGLNPLIDLGQSTKFLVFGVLDATPYFWLALTVLIIVIFVERLVKNSRVGRMWEATREDEDAAEIMGVPTFKFKLLAFALGCLHRRTGRRVCSRRRPATSTRRASRRVSRSCSWPRSSSAGRVTAGVRSSAPSSSPTSPSDSASSKTSVCCSSVSRSS